MRFLWKAFKVLLAIAFGIPLLIIALGVGFGILGAMVGLAILVLKLACVALLAWVVFRVVAGVFGGDRRAATPLPPRPLPPPDPHYQEAMRELEEALGERPPRR